MRGGKTQFWSHNFLVSVPAARTVLCMCDCLSYIKDHCSQYTLINEVYSTVVKTKHNHFCTVTFFKATKVFERMFVININRQHKFKKFSGFVQ